MYMKAVQLNEAGSPPSLDGAMQAPPAPSSAASSSEYSCVMSAGGDDQDRRTVIMRMILGALPARACGTKSRERREPGHAATSPRPRMQASCGG